MKWGKIKEKAKIELQGGKQGIKKGKMKERTMLFYLGLYDPRKLTTAIPIPSAV